MANYQEKITGKTIKKTSYANLSASFASSPSLSSTGSVVDSRVFETFTGSKAIRFLPHRITQGPLNEIFPGLKEGTSHGRIDTASGIFRDTENKIVYVPIKKSDYLLNRIGPGSKISSSFGPNAYAQVSASYAAKFANVDDDIQFLFAVEEFYTAGANSSSKYTTASFADDNVGAFTGSFEMRRQSNISSVINTPAYSAIDNSVHVGYNGTNYNIATGYRDVPRFILDFRSSSFATHWQMKFTGPHLSGSEPYYNADILFPTAAMIFHGNTPGADYQTSSIALEDGGPFLTPSGTLLSKGTPTLINPNNAADGGYVSYKLAAKISGDSDSGSLYTFPGLSQVIIYSSSLSGSGALGQADFEYHPTLRSVATSSAVIKTLYFYTGSSNDILEDYHFYITGAELNAQLGAPMHGDEYLSSNADIGFYSPSGSQFSSSFQVQTSSANPGEGPVFAQYYSAGN